MLTVSTGPRPPSVRPPQNITWGDTIPVNWLNAPQGNVSIDLVKNPGGDLAYHIATVPGTSEPGYCDAGFGLGTVVKVRATP